MVLLLTLLPFVGRAQRVSTTWTAKQLVGDQVCSTCHQQQSDLYVHTAHHTTSAPVVPPEFKHLLQLAGTELTITEAPLPRLSFEFTVKNDRVFQTAATGWGSDQARLSESMDMIIGSGTRGQTFLYWAGDQLFELPVSYWVEKHGWINSPGYVDGTADFKRPVQPGCLECHATFALALSTDAGNSYERSSLVYGISCETCHGPGQAHVAAERSAATQGTRGAQDAAILNPAHFSRDRQIDLCALCHSGIQRTALAPAFSYVPGQPLSTFYKPANDSEQTRPDVHGNQVGLLERSRCFRASPDMTCSTCHDVHSAEKPAASYSPRCLSCHRWQSCGEAHRIGAAIQADCITCHMPVQPTEAIVSTTAGARIQASMRTHWIKVYETKDAGVEGRPISGTQSR